MSTLDVAVAVPPNHFTPQKRKSTAASRALDSTTFLATPLLQADDVLAVSSDSDTLFPLLCSRIDMLHLSSEKLRTGLVDCQTSLADSFQSLGIEVELLRDNLGSDPGLTDVPLRSAWEGIAWVKASVADALKSALPVLQNIPPPLSQQDVQKIVASSLAPSVTQSHALATKVNALDTTINSHLPRLCDLYSVCSGGVTSKPAEALAARLNSISTRLSILDNHVARSQSPFGL